MRRPAAPTDLEQVFAIYMHPAVVPYLGFDPMPEESFRAVFEGLLQRGSFFVWEVAGRVAGFYEVTRYPGRASHVACLGSLAVDPALHGSGVAHAMVAGAIALARTQGARRIELFVEADNPRGLRFYEKLGFAVEGTLRGFYRRASDPGDVDEIVMGLLLYPPAT